MNAFTSYHGIWAIEAGDELIAMETLTMDAEDNYPFGPMVVFTAGRHYPVLSMHPVADPPFVIVIDDDGHENRIQPDFLLHFRHVRGDRRAQQRPHQVKEKSGQSSNA